jgi:ferrous iron transport protein A
MTVVLDRPCRVHNNGIMTHDLSSPAELLLGNAPIGFIGTILMLKPGISAPDQPELERQLLEMGFTEGARVEILHEGAIARDPIAVRVNNITIALRRREAMAVVVQ